jgi:hypothetical protein
MSHHTTAVDVSHLAAFDTDGAIEEAAHRINSRRRFLGGAGALLGGAALVALPGSASAATPKSDIAILNFALTLEYLESAFYGQALKSAGLSGRLERFAKTVNAHEATHVTTLRKVLGSKAVKRPSFDFKGTTSSSSAFTATSILLEDTGVMAYQGQAANIRSQTVFKAAISIHPVEARHAAWIRDIAGQSPASASFNPAKTMSQILAAVGGTGFIKS